jgi:CRISPR-associated protein Csm3
MSQKIPAIIGKIEITGCLELKTGLHIGTSGDFSPIGAVDSIVIRDPVTKQPIIPGSSVKGKMRSLLAAVYSETNWLPKVDDEPDKVTRLFGLGGKTIRRSRLQFSDLFMNQDSANRLVLADTDLYLTEIKFENFINRITSVANPRQLERVPAGSQFDFKLMYTVENNEEFLEDMTTLGQGLLLLQLDYLGQGGSRGNGRVAFSNIDMQVKLDVNLNVNLEKGREVLHSALQA